MSVLAFDLDGTLVTCEPRQSAVLKAVTVAEGLNVDVAAAWRLKRQGITTLQALCQAGVPYDMATRIVTRWTEIIEAPEWLSLDTPLDGVNETLAHAQRDGHELILVTARRRREWLLHQLAQLGLAQFFRSIAVVEGANVGFEKARALHARRAEYFIGDTEQDAKAASYAELPFIAVSTGQRDADFLRARGVKNCEKSIRMAYRVIASADHIYE